MSALSPRLVELLHARFPNTTAIMVSPGPESCPDCGMFLGHEGPCRP